MLTKALVAIAIVGVVALIITGTLIYRKDPKEFRREAAAAIGMLLAMAIFGGLTYVGVNHDKIFRGTELDQLNAAIEMYEKNGDISALDKLAISDEFYLQRVSEYLLQSQSPLAAEKYLEFWDVALDSLNLGDSHSENYKLLTTEGFGLRSPPHRTSGKFLLIRDDRALAPDRRRPKNPSPRDLGIFAGLAPSEISTITHDSIVFAYHAFEGRGTYTDGSSANRRIVCAFVIDTITKSVIAHRVFRGGMPSKTVSTGNIFSSRTGSHVDLDDIEDWYMDLPQKLSITAH